MKITKLQRKKKPPISDPLSDAREKTGLEFTRLPEQALGRAENPWDIYETFHTTGQFKDLGRGYQQHCGPTAMTNILCTLDRRYEYPSVHSETPEAIFEKAALIGKHRLLYINTNLFGFWGGSNSLLIYFYLRACLRYFKVRDIRVRGRLFATAKQAARELEKGRLLVFQVYSHKIYGTHLVTAYGLSHYQAADGRIRTYFQLADGWSTRPRYLALEDVRVCGYFSLEKKS